MSDDADDIDDDGEGGGGGGKVSGKKLVLFIILPILILIGVGAGLLLSGMLDPLLGVKEEEVVEEAPVEEVGPVEPGIYESMDEMLVTLRGTGSKQKFLKLQLSLELEAEEDRARLQNVMPRIIDNFQVFLRELRLEELEGSQGVYRIKEELIDRVNQAAAPVKIKDVLIKDMLIQ